ncbi:response regulator [Asticcacaulis biprosthecium C19]|uniref:Response regulator n=1 Tax=Asticcacaulis biprosthecium C19 TaxID=715226 RepID=F4QK76_9CAUL|nr:response regulator transcription factor [Asticcacaulis biprosthecium]EGF93254.1 response regulator [Asticcacaulis biprosthecium C19]
MTSQTKILLVDDEPEIRSMLSIFLGVEDYDIIEADSGKAALRQIIGAKPDLIVLDLGLPEMDGQEVITAVRKFSNTPIVVLTARSDDSETVKALNAGADDYVTKPFRAEILLARIQANLRQGKTVSEPDAIDNGPVHMDIGRHEVRLNGTLVAFTPKEFALLEFFVRNRGRMLTHKQILKEVWGPAHTDDTQYLRVYIGQVREKLATVPGLGQSITSESGIGYRMELLTAAVAVAAE